LFRPAREDDLPALVALVTEDEGVVDDRYRAAFDAVVRDARNELLVAEDEGEVVACLQLTYIPGLGGHGRERAHLEAVRVRADRRGEGIGGELIRHAIERARERGCTLVQLMSNRRRVDAHRFYGSLGFAESHAGFKRTLE
jgi:GNAT superfamily N-acetyltransferase